jgi:hypothetical protein
MTPLDLAPSLDAASWRAAGSLGQEIGDQVSLRTACAAPTAARYPIRLCFLRIVRDGRSLMLAIGDDLSPELAAIECALAAVPGALQRRRQPHARPGLPVRAARRRPPWPFPT